MAKLTLADIGNLLGNPTSAATAVNNNSTAIEAALENTLSRNGAGPNQMLADIDLNNNDLLNVKSLDVDELTLGGVPVTSATLLDPSPLLDIPFIPTVGGLLTTPRIKWAQLGVTPRDFVSTAGTDDNIDDTLAVQSAINYCAANGLPLDLMHGLWNATYLNIPSGGGTFEIIGNGAIRLTDTASRACGLEILRGNFVITGSLTIFGQFKYNYDFGVWIHNNSQLQYADLSELVIVGCKGGIRVGDINYGGAIISEITINMPRTYGVPRPFQIEGAQTYATVLAPPALSADGFGGDGAWNSQTFRAVMNKGANLTIIGGEIIQTASGSATDFLVEIQPCLQGADLSWGRTTMLGVTIESGGPLCLINNPSGLTGSSGANDVPFVLFQNCVGYHSQNNEHYIKALQYPGKVRWEGSTTWYNGGGTRTFASIYCDSDLTTVESDNYFFGNGFRNGLSGVVGGILRFTNRQIAQVFGLPNTAFTSSGVTSSIKWQSWAGDINKNRFQANYVTSTGTFTAPAGGLSNCLVTVRLYCNVTGYAVLRSNGTEIGRGSFANGACNFSVDIGAVAANTALTVDVVTTGAGAIPDQASQFLHQFTIQAGN